jgi:hypothetical protein
MRDKYHDGYGNLLDPALTAFRSEANELQQRTPQKFNAPTYEEILEILSYIPRLGKKITDDQNRFIDYKPDELDSLPISINDYAEYLYRKNGTRRFLVDSNNLYLNIRASEGAALEPFKRAHRYIDVLKEYENLVALQRKNERRETHMQEPEVYDPDIEKVIIVGDDANSSTTRHAALSAAMTPSDGSGSSSGQPVTAPTVSSASTDGSTESRTGENGTP